MSYDDSKYKIVGTNEYDADELVQVLKYEVNREYNADLKPFLNESVISDTNNTFEFSANVSVIVFVVFDRYEKQPAILDNMIKVFEDPETCDAVCKYFGHNYYVQPCVSFVENNKVKFMPTIYVYNQAS